MVEAPAVLALMRGFLRAGRKFPDYNLRQCVRPPAPPPPPGRRPETVGTLGGGVPQRQPPGLPPGVPFRRHEGTWGPRSLVLGACGRPNPAPGLVLLQGALGHTVVGREPRSAED